MKSTLVISAFENFNLISSDFEVKQLTSGHINQTYLIKNAGKHFILQKLNTDVFENLKAVTNNIAEVSKHLKKKSYPHKIIQPLVFQNGEFLWENQWRLFTYFENTKTYEKSASPKQAFEAAKFLREFHVYLQNVEPDKISSPIPGFLDFNSRLKQYETSLKNASTERLNKAKKELSKIKQHKFLLEKWSLLLPDFPEHVIHGDPKISNFLFAQDSPNKIVALIDWDTLMPGPLLYDFGDMVRSYTNLREEDDPTVGQNFSKNYFCALKNGFLQNFSEQLSDAEKQHLTLAGQTVIYIQAMRFLTDYLNEDLYYNTNRPNQNLDRTRNQLNLLEEMIQVEGEYA
ncbi:MAG TPA: aminoglycoside phosphotransferase family protein [Flavobacteriaceae bacterium]|nr:aminoglycoside phosphotransferase family protein [Flavobacteriaceae bacterium]